MLRKNTMNQLKSFAQDCVNQYATYAKSDEFYSLDVSELPDFVLHEFAALIVAHHDYLGIEATGPDNKHWDKRMLPALTKYLADSTDKDAQIQFSNEWRDCVADYMTGKMQELIDDALYSFNDDHGCIREPNYYYGVRAHG
jgi:hypothetical protein